MNNSEGFKHGEVVGAEYTWGDKTRLDNLVARWDAYCKLPEEEKLKLYEHWVGPPYTPAAMNSGIEKFEFNNFVHSHSLSSFLRGDLYESYLKLSNEAKELIIAAMEFPMVAERAMRSASDHITQPYREGMSFRDHIEQDSFTSFILTNLQSGVAIGSTASVATVEHGLLGAIMYDSNNTSERLLVGEREDKFKAWQPIERSDTEATVYAGLNGQAHASGEIIAPVIRSLVDSSIHMRGRVTIQCSLYSMEGVYNERLKPGEFSLGQTYYMNSDELYSLFDTALKNYYARAPIEDHEDF
ncbi:MAG: hypothetical protein V4611_01185 [Patescibacteria group bacterium]